MDSVVRYQPLTRYLSVQLRSCLLYTSQLHALGFKPAAMALSDRSVRIDDPALAAEPKLAIVLGTEGDGLANSTRCV